MAEPRWKALADRLAPSEHKTFLRRLAMRLIDCAGSGRR
jgi:hypothetical protein